MTRRTVEFGCAIVVVGLLAGVAGAVTTLLLHGVEHLTYHYTFGTLLTGVGDSSPVRRALGPMVGGALAGGGWWILRRCTEVPSLSAAISSPKPLPRLSLSIDAVLQVLLVGAGASLGREGAPRQLAAALSDFATTRLSLTARDREILLACAAGAGLGAVYSVPLGGALFAARILLGTWHPRAVGAALITSSLAVAVASPVTHLEHALTWPSAHLSYLFAFLALAISPLAGAVGLAFNRVMATARPKVQFRSWILIPTVAAAGLLTGICSIMVAGSWQRQKHPHGQHQQRPDARRGGHHPGVEAAVDGVVPASGGGRRHADACTGDGRRRGIGCRACAQSLGRTDIDVAALSSTCGAGVLTITQKAPAFAALFVWELARPPYWLLVVFAIAAYAAHGLRLLRERRIETGRRQELTDRNGAIPS